MAKTKSKSLHGIMAILLVMALLDSLVAVLVTSENASANPKSMYLIADHHTAQFDAWEIKSGCTVEYQATHNLTHADDPAGINGRGFDYAVCYHRILSVG